MATDSILDSVKNYLGIFPEYDVFDEQIKMHINMTFATLYQLGVGEIDDSEPIRIEDSNMTWTELFADHKDLISLIKEYTSAKVRVVFDPPSSSFVLEQLNKLISELEFRIIVQAEGGLEDEPGNVKLHPTPWR